MMLEKVGYVYDDYEMSVLGDLEDYFSQHPELVGLDTAKTIKDSFFCQDDKLGLVFVMKLDDNTRISVAEWTVTKALSEIHSITFHKIFFDAAAEIVYMLTLDGVDEK